MSVPLYDVKIALDRDNKKLYLVTDAHYGSNNYWGTRFDNNAVFVSGPIYCDDEDRTKKGMWKLLFLRFNVINPKSVTVNIYKKSKHFAEFKPSNLIPDFTKTFVPKDGENWLEIKDDTYGLPLISESIQIEIIFPYLTASSLFRLYEKSNDDISHLNILRNGVADVWVEYDEVGDKFADLE